VTRSFSNNVLHHEISKLFLLVLTATFRNYAQEIKLLLPLKVSACYNFLVTILGSTI